MRAARVQGDRKQRHRSHSTGVYSSTLLRTLLAKAEFLLRDRRARAPRRDHRSHAPYASRLGILVAQLVGQVLWDQEISSRVHFKLMGVNNGPKSRAVPGRI